MHMCNLLCVVVVITPVACSYLLDIELHIVIIVSDVHTILSMTYHDLDRST